MSLKRAYPRTAEIRRMMEAARAGGLDVAGVEISPDGHIRLLSADAVPKAVNDFDRWEDRL